MHVHVNAIRLKAFELNLCFLLLQVCEAALGPSKPENKSERNASKLYQVSLTCMSLLKRPAAATYTGSYLPQESSTLLYTFN